MSLKGRYNMVQELLNQGLTYKQTCKIMGITIAELYCIINTPGFNKVVIANTSEKLKV
ncbi:hypothetical protein [Bacillus sp. Brlt_9]|uniref:hypothetical protein n=1 Tax=Bacillus sp. Brlt_9 TaxID=3110916 RepID=UPI003F7B7EFC